VGRHGIGKSEIVRDFFEARGERVVSLFLGQMSDPGDIIGLPRIAGDRTEFLPPWWFATDGKPVTLFLDELNRARPEILQCVMDLTLNRILAGKKLPDKSRIISAVNEGDEYQLTDLDPALVSRFNIYHFNPTAGEWLAWAAGKSVDRRIIEFIEKYPESLDSTVIPESGLERSADRRSWKRVSDFITGIKVLDETKKKGIAGIIGPEMAAQFIHHLTTSEKAGAREIFAGFPGFKQELEKWSAHELTNLNEGSFRIFITEEDDNTIRQFVKNLELYLTWLRDTNKNEALAHWATLFESDAYPKAKKAILLNSETIYDTVIEFIEKQGT
jgi:hypothetical protein